MTDRSPLALASGRYDAIDVARGVAIAAMVVYHFSWDLRFFGFIAVGGTFYVHSLQLTRSALLAGFATGALAAVLIVINNLRDVAGDRASNKRTLAVRFGERFARAEVAFFAFVPFAAIVWLAWMRTQWGLLMPLAALPLALLVVLRVMRSRGAELNRCLAIAGGLQWAFGILFVLGSLV